MKYSVLIFTTRYRRGGRFALKYGRKKTFFFFRSALGSSFPHAFDFFFLIIIGRDAAKGGRGEGEIAAGRLPEK